MHIKTKGLVIRDTRIKEADKLLTIITAKGTKLTAKARGVLRKKSPLAPGCQLYCYSEFTLFEGRGSVTVSEAEPLSMFLGLRTSAQGLSLAAYICEILDKISDSDSQSPELSRLGLNMLYAVSENLAPLELIRGAFEARAAALAGYAPDLSLCSVCGAPASRDFLLDRAGPSPVCPDCAPGFSGALLPSPVFAALRHYMSAPVERLLSPRLTPEQIPVLTGFTENYLRDMLGVASGALKFYKNLQNPYPISSNG